MINKSGRWLILAGKIGIILTLFGIATIALSFFIFAATYGSHTTGLNGAIQSLLLTAHDSVYSEVYSAGLPYGEVLVFGATLLVIGLVVRALSSRQVSPADEIRGTE